MNNSKGQNILEYILLVVAFVLVVLYFLGPRGPFKRAVNDVLDGSIDQIDRMVHNITFDNPK
ncbi:MAG: hypothetical protein WC552_00070 [Candidatus Omnitrophota bacterium]